MPGGTVAHFYAGAVHLSLITIVVEEYDPAINFFVTMLGFELTAGCRAGATGPSGSGW